MIGAALDRRQSFVYTIAICYLQPVYVRAQSKRWHWHLQLYVHGEEYVCPRSERNIT